MELLTEKTGPAKSVLLMLHGGAYMLGLTNTYRTIAQRYKKQLQIDVASLDYRFGPQHTWPAALDDAFECYQKL